MSRLSSQTSGSRECANAMNRMGELECKFSLKLLKRRGAEMQGR